SEGLSDGGIAEQWMLCLGARALAVDLGPRIGAVDLDVLDPAALHDLSASFGVAGVFEFDKDFVLDLHIPGIVVLAGLNHRARRRYGVAAAFHLDRVEIRPVGDVVGRIAFALYQIARRELDKPVRTGSHRLHVRWSLA